MGPVTIECEWLYLSNYACCQGCRLLQCYEQLTKWPELEQAVMINVDDHDPPQLDKIWEDNYRQVNISLPLYFVIFTTLPLGYVCHHYYPTPTGAILAVHPACQTEASL